MREPPEREDWIQENVSAIEKVGFVPMCYFLLSIPALSIGEDILLENPCQIM